MAGIERASQIFGWMSIGELGFLAQQAMGHSRIVEIGSFMGRSTRALAENTPGVVYAVDTWAGSDEDEHRKLLEGKSPDWLFEEFQKNMKGLDNVQMFRETSLEAAKDASEQDMQFDMIFIDASHDYENVKADILAWRQLLAPGGLLCGHDFHSGAPGVVSAVQEFLPQARAFESIWYAVL